MYVEKERHTHTHTERAHVAMADNCTMMNM